MATIYLDNCTLATSVSNILTSSRSHHNRLMTCCLCLTMPHVSKISIISQVSPCLGPTWNVLARLVSWHLCLGKSLCLRKMFWLHHFMHDKAYHPEPNLLPAASLTQRKSSISSRVCTCWYRPIPSASRVLFSVCDSTSLSHLSRVTRPSTSSKLLVYATCNLKYLAYLHIISN